MAHYLFNVTNVDIERARALMRRGTWGIDAGQPHRDALAAGDLVLIYVAAPVSTFIGRAEVASAADAEGVLLAHLEEWDPPVPMTAVLAEIGPSETAKAEFPDGVVRIAASEYEAALAVVFRRRPA